MARSLAKIEEEIRELSSEDRAELLRVLLDELDAPEDSGVEQAWLDEVERRVAELDSGSVALVPAEKVFAEIDALFEK